MNLLFSFKGRAGRAHYWLTSLGAGVVGTLVFALLTAMVSPAAAKDAPPPMSTGNIVIFALMALAFIAMMWISLAVGAKRCHDRGRSGWFQLIGLIPIIGGLWLLVELGFLRGEDGANTYGVPVVPATA